MQEANGQKHLAASKTRVRPWISILAAVIVLALLVVLGFRMHGWLARGQESRLTVLVNPWNGVDNSGFSPSLTDFEGVQIDKSIKKPLGELLSACRQAGLDPVLSAGYRSYEQQQALFEQTAKRLMSERSLSESEAAEEAAMQVGRPGTSEHQLGLAVDFADDGALLQWLEENAWQYGFVLRYPEGCEETTGRSADPCHYRYVGTAAAEQIHAMGTTLEEYLSFFYGDSAQVIFE